MRSAVLTAMAAAALAACAANPEAQRVCTLIGCENGLAVEVNHSLEQSFAVEVRVGAQTIHTFHCDPGRACRAFINNQTPAEVTVTIDAGGGQQPISKVYRPAYTLNRPNGADCPPECRQATITLSVS